MAKLTRRKLLKTTAYLERLKRERCSQRGCRTAATFILYTGRDEGIWHNGYRGRFCARHGRRELARERDLQTGGLGGAVYARVGATGRPSVGVLSDTRVNRTLWICNHEHKTVHQAFKCARAERERRGWKTPRGDTA